MAYTIGIDVGGTFTDLVAIDEHGATVFAKSPSTPQDQSIGEHVRAIAARSIRVEPRMRFTRVFSELRME